MGEEKAIPSAAPARRAWEMAAEEGGQGEEQTPSTLGVTDREPCASREPDPVPRLQRPEALSAPDLHAAPQTCKRTECAQVPLALPVCPGIHSA